MADVRSDSRIRIVDKSGTIKTVIFEEDYERLGYKAAGWTIDKGDWTKEREVRQPVDATKEMGIAQLGKV
ncbi:MAG: hypothetical protein NC184_05650 [Roseburia sp.]|nr:hypothetical protein [Roseburia sp.]